MLKFCVFYFHVFTERFNNVSFEFFLILVYKISFDEILEKSTDGYCRKLLIALSKMNRDENFKVNKTIIRDNAELIFEAENGFYLSNGEINLKILNFF